MRKYLALLLLIAATAVGATFAATAQKAFAGGGQGSQYGNNQGNDHGNPGDNQGDHGGQKPGNGNDHGNQGGGPGGHGNPPPCGQHDNNCGDHGKGGGNEGHPPTQVTPSTGIFGCGVNNLRGSRTTAESGLPGTPVLVGKYTVPAALQGKIVQVVLSVHNNGSTREGSDVQIVSGGTQVTDSNVEHEADFTKDQSGTLSLGTEVDLYVIIGPKGVFSGSGAATVTVDCSTPTPPSTPAPTPTPAPRRRRRRPPRGLRSRRPTST